MQILGRFGLLILCCSVLELYNIVFQIFLGFFMMDSASLLEVLSRKSEFGCGVSAFGRFARACNVMGLFVMFGLGLKLLGIRCHYKSLSRLLCDCRRKSSYTKDGIFFFPKILCYNCNFLRFFKNSKVLILDKLVESEELASTLQEDDDAVDLKCCDEYEKFDATALRRMIKIERERAESACLELEKERLASATAAEEAMAMILRLQNEKSSIELEAHQFRRVAEQRLNYDQEVIHFLRWTLMKYESESRPKLDEEDASQEGDQTLISCMSSAIEGDLVDLLISSLAPDFHLSAC